MNIVEIWMHNDWVIKTLIVATMVVLVIALEKGYQFFKVAGELKALKGIESVREFEQLKGGEVQTILQDIDSFKNEDKALFNSNVGIKLDIFESSQMRFVGIISTIATLSPMLGLIGTFIGVWHVFEGVGSVGLNDPAIIARGIKEVLVDTMAGLIVAVISMVFYKIFEYLGQKNILTFEDKLYKLLKSEDAKN